MQVRVKSNFKAMEKLKGIEDWFTIANILRKANHENYKEYIRSLQELRTNYFLRLRFFSELNSKTGILEDFLIDDRSSEVWLLLIEQ